MAVWRLTALGLLIVLALGCGRTSATGATQSTAGQPTAPIAVPVTRVPTTTACPGEIPVPPLSQYVQVFSPATTSATVPLGGYLLVVLPQGEGAIPPDGSFAWNQVTNSDSFILSPVTEPGLCPGKSYSSSLPMARYAYQAKSEGEAILSAPLTSACQQYGPCEKLGPLHLIVTVKQ